MIIILFILISLTSCKQEKREITILSPSGAPSLSLIELMKDNDLDIEIVDGAESIQGSFTSNDKDIIIAPINLGYKLSTLTNNYLLLGIITYGNLMYVSRIENPSIIASFQESAIPGQVISSIKDELPSDNIEWYSSTSEVTQLFLSGKYDSVIIAEPNLSLIKTKISDKLYILDIQDLFNTKFNLTSYPQAALFVSKNKLEKNKEDVINIFEKIIDSTNEININNEVLNSDKNKALISKIGYTNSELIINNFDKLNVNPDYAYNHIDEISKILELCNLNLDISYIYEN